MHNASNSILNPPTSLSEGKKIAYVFSDSSTVLKILSNRDFSTHSLVVPLSGYMLKLIGWWSMNPNYSIILGYWSTWLVYESTINRFAIPFPIYLYIYYYIFHPCSSPPAGTLITRFIANLNQILSNVQERFCVRADTFAIILIFPIICFEK